MQKQEIAKNKTCMLKTTINRIEAKYIKINETNTHKTWKTYKQIISKNTRYANNNIYNKQQDKIKKDKTQEKQNETTKTKTENTTMRKATKQTTTTTITTNTCMYIYIYIYIYIYMHNKQTSKHTET